MSEAAIGQRQPTKSGSLVAPEKAKSKPEDQDSINEAPAPEWRRVRYENKASCPDPADCSRTIVVKTVTIDRYEKLPQLTSASPYIGRPSISWKDLVTLAADGASSDYRLHYVDTVEYSYLEELFDVTEYEIGPNDRFVGPYESQEWIPAGGELLNVKIIETKFKGGVRITNVPFDKR